MNSVCPLSLMIIKKEFRDVSVNISLFVDAVFYIFKLPSEKYLETLQACREKVNDNIKLQQFNYLHVCTCFVFEHLKLVLNREQMKDVKLNDRKKKEINLLLTPIFSYRTLGPIQDPPPFCL